jgi:hypothetical protein
VRGTGQPWKQCGPGGNIDVPALEIAVKTTITTRARSPIGTFLALALVAATLVIAGLYLITDGRFFTRLSEIFANLAAARSLTQGIQDNLKKYDRPQLITVYALMIVGGAAAVGVIGSFIRTNQYRFLAGEAGIEKRGLWLYLPLCAIAWALLTGLVMLCDKWLVTGIMRGLFGQGIYDRISGWIIPFLWPAVSGAIAWGLLWTLWRRVERYLDRSLFVPGLRRRVPYTKVKRMEIQNSGEGSTVLVLVLANGATWTIQTGRLKRLQRLGALLSRRLGLERRDLVTWA